jgi:broad specificity phosphatase PhoE
MAFFYLVRHGQTDLIGKMLCGDIPGIHLNEAGRLQAQKAADFLSGFQIKAVYTSPIERANETAAAIAERVGLEPVWADFLKEINFGELQSLASPDLKKHSVWQHFLQNPGEVEFPGGERVSEAQKRVVAGLDALSGQFA